MATYTSDNTLQEKVVWQVNDRRISMENFFEENVDELIKTCQFNLSIFSPIKFLCHTVFFKNFLGIASFACYKTIYSYMLNERYI